MITAVLCAGALVAQVETQSVDLLPRQDAAIVILTPMGASTRTGASELLSAAAAAFERSTDLRVRPATELGIDVDAMFTCPKDQRLSCWVKLAVPARVSVLLIVTVAPAQNEDRVAMTALDPAEAAGLPDEEIFGLIAEVPPRGVIDPRATFAEAIDGGLREFLDRRGHLIAAGNAILEHDCAGCTVEVAGRTIDLVSRRVELRALRAGSHQISVGRGGEVLCRAEVNVTAGRTAQAACLGLAPVPDSSRALIYAGIAGGVAGVAAIAASAVIFASGPDQICLGRDRSKCEYVSSARSGFGSGVQELDAARSGFPLLQVGSGLAVAGAAWTAGGLFFEEQPWWLTLLGGVAIGVGTSAVMFAVE